MATYHGGDAGGDPPPHNWRPAFGCSASGTIFDYAQI